MPASTCLLRPKSIPLTVSHTFYTLPFRAFFSVHYAVRTISKWHLPNLHTYTWKIRVDSFETLTALGPLRNKFPQRHAHFLPVAQRVQGGKVMFDLLANLRTNMLKDTPISFLLRKECRVVGS